MLMPDNGSPALSRYAGLAYVGSALGGIATAVLLMYGIGEDRAWGRALAVIVGCASMLALATTVTAVQIGRLRRDVGDVREEQAAAKEAILEALGTLAYDIRRLTAHAENQLGVSHNLSTAVEEAAKQVEELRIAWGGSEIGPDASGNIMPLPSQETREAARRLARRIIQREEHER